MRYARLSVQMVRRISEAVYAMWKPDQKDADRVARAEMVFWSATLTILVVLVTSPFFRR